jgi:hypothetical protein
MDGNALDEKQYIWGQGCCSSPICSLNEIAVKVQIFNDSKQWHTLSPFSLNPTKHEI